MPARTSLLLLIATFCLACGSTNKTYVGTAPKYPGVKGEQTVKGKQVSKIVKPGKVPAIGVELDPGLTVGPARLKKDIAAGRNWLILLRPIGFSYAGSELISGRTLFKPQSAVFTFAQGKSGGKSGSTELEPTLLRLEGTVTRDDSSALLKAVPDPEMEIEGLGSVDNKSMRILLGRGIDNSLAMANKKQGGTTDFDTREWIAVLDKDDNQIKNWREVLAASVRDGHFDRIWELDVLTRRWRPGSNPPATYFKVPFPLVVACGHMKVERETEKEGFHWTWEGIWASELRKPPTAGLAQPMEASPEPLVLYKEYKGSRKKSVTFWKTLLTPVALGVDFGSSVFDSLVDTESDADVFERTTEKQKARD